MLLSTPLWDIRTGNYEFGRDGIERFLGVLSSRNVSQAEDALHIKKGVPWRNIEYANNQDSISML